MNDRLINVPDMKPHEGKINEGVRDGTLRTSSVTLPSKLAIRMDYLVPPHGSSNMGNRRGRLMDAYVRMMSHILQRFDQEGVFAPGEEADTLFKHIVENEMTPLANEEYKPA